MTDWYYPLIAFVGFFGTLSLWGMFGGTIFDDNIDLGIIITFLSSALVPTISLIIIHRYNQKRRSINNVQETEN